MNGYSSKQIPKNAFVNKTILHTRDIKNKDRVGILNLKFNLPVGSVGMQNQLAHTHSNRPCPVRPVQRATLSNAINLADCEYSTVKFFNIIT